MQKTASFGKKSNTFFYYIVYQYISGKNEKKTKVFTWGLAEHGALGEREFLKPIRQGRRPVEYMHRPYRLGFADENEVNYYWHKLYTLKNLLCIPGYRYRSWLWIYSVCCQKQEIIITTFWNRP
jgi:hypothetical protein